MFLAGRDTAVEPTQLLRHPVSGAMEHNDALPRLPPLSSASAAMVPEFLLSTALVPGRARGVSPGPGVDGPTLRGSGRRAGIRTERSGSELSYVAGHDRGARMDAMGCPGCRTRIAERRSRPSARDRCRRNADADRSARDYHFHMGNRYADPGAHLLE